MAPKLFPASPPPPKPSMAELSWSYSFFKLLTFFKFWLKPLLCLRLTAVQYFMEQIVAGSNWKSKPDRLADFLNWVIIYMGRGETFEQMNSHWWTPLKIPHFYLNVMYTPHEKLHRSNVYIATIKDSFFMHLWVCFCFPRLQLSALPGTKTKNLIELEIR